MSRIFFLAAMLIIAFTVAALGAEIDNALNRAVHLQINNLSSGVETGYMKLDSPRTAWLMTLGLDGVYRPPQIDSDDSRFYYSGGLSLGAHRRWYLRADKQLRPYLSAGVQFKPGISVSDYSDDSESDMVKSVGTTWSGAVIGLAGLECLVGERVAVSAQYSLSAQYNYLEQRYRYRNHPSKKSYRRSFEAALSGVYVGLTLFFH